MWHAIEHSIEFLPKEYLVFGLISKEFRKIYLTYRPMTSTICYYLESEILVDLICTPNILYEYLAEFGFDFDISFSLHSHSSDLKISCEKLSQLISNFTSGPKIDMLVVEDMYKMICSSLKCWSLSQKKFMSRR